MYGPGFRVCIKLKSTVRSGVFFLGFEVCSSLRLNGCLGLKRVQGLRSVHVGICLYIYIYTCI